MNQILINTAKDGGYSVESYTDYGDRRQMLFAGTLDACLEYIRDKLYSDELSRNQDVVS